MSNLQLRLRTEGKPDTTVIVNQEEFIIGRLPECNLCLPFSEISRYHARIFKAEQQNWLVEDLGSTNGTILNRIKIASPQPMNHGDVIQVGNVFLFVFFFQSYGEAETVTAPATEMEARTIQRSAEKLQQRWMGADVKDSLSGNEQRAISRLQELVKIAKGLNSAASIEDIFQQVQKVVFRELTDIERLALLVDVERQGELNLLNSAFRNDLGNATSHKNGSWISGTICQKVFHEKVAIKTLDAQADDRFDDEDSILSNEIRGALAVPLWDEKQVMGVLYADAHYGWSMSKEIDDDDLSFFSALANLVASSVQRWLLTRKLQGEARIRTQLERYHSPAVVKQLIKLGTVENNGRIPPIEADISVLFADIVGFSAMSERLGAAEISALLNRFFEEMLPFVFEANGTLDKYIGDCIMAFFGAPEPQNDHADRAVAAALGMLAHLDHLNSVQTWSESLQLRISINSGKAVVGDVGSSQRLDYTVLGGTVNLAARLEGVCPPSECVISQDTHNLLQEQAIFVKMKKYRFKGIDRPIQVYVTQRNAP